MIPKTVRYFSQVSKTRRALIKGNAVIVIRIIFVNIIISE